MVLGTGNHLLGNNILPDKFRHHLCVRLKVLGSQSRFCNNTLLDIDQ